MAYVAHHNHIIGLFSYSRQPATAAPYTIVTTRYISSGITSQIRPPQLDISPFCLCSGRRLTDTDVQLLATDISAVQLQAYSSSGTPTATESFRGAAVVSRLKLKVEGRVSQGLD